MIEYALLAFSTAFAVGGAVAAVLHLRLIAQLRADLSVATRESYAARTRLAEMWQLAGEHPHPPFSHLLAREEMSAEVRDLVASHQTPHQRARQLEMVHHLQRRGLTMHQIFLALSPK